MSEEQRKKAKSCLEAIGSHLFGLPQDSGMFEQCNSAITDVMGSDTKTDVANALHDAVIEYCDKVPGDERCGCYKGDESDKAQDLFDSLTDTQRASIGAGPDCLNIKCRKPTQSKGYLYDTFYVPGLRDSCQDVKFCRQNQDVKNVKSPFGLIVKQVCDIDSTSDEPTLNPVPIIIIGVVTLIIVLIMIKR